jgi:DNA polymerase-3 subunit epsilon
VTPGPRRRFAAVLAALAGYVLAGVGLLGLGVYAGVDRETQDALAGALRSQAAFLVFGVGLLVAGLGVLVWRFLAVYVTPLRRLAADTRLIVTTNPGHRLDVARPRDLAALGAAVNELASRYQTARGVADARSAADRAELEEDRDRLAALMSDLAVGVLVCNLDGRILLHNAAARELLGAAGRSWVGLGRSIFGVLDRELIAHAVERIHGGADSVQTAAVAGADRLLRVRVAPVRGSGGYVLTLEDMTRRAEAGQRRDTALRALSEGTRAPLAAIRAAIENILDYPDMAPDERERFAEIIREETHRLSAHVERTIADSAGYLTDRWQLEDVRGADLLAAVARGVRSGGEVEASVTEPVTELWLEAETHRIAQAVADLVGRLGVARVALSVSPAGGHGALDLRWPDSHVDGKPEDTVRGWSAEARVAELLARHDGEAWAATDATGPYVRVLLRRSRAEPVTARAAATPTTSRPEFYDFDLFRVTAPGAWDARPLSDLAYTVFDTETTGLAPSEGDEIISIGAARIINGRLLHQELYEQLVDPGRSVPAASQRIHGITPAMLAGQPPIGDVLPDLARFADGSVLLGHNVAFDLKFLALKEAATGVRFDQPVLDTLLLSPVAHPDHQDHSLEAIAARLGVNILGRHTALGDALLTGEIFLRLIPVLAERGIVTLGQAREAARRTQQARIRY